MMTSSNHVAVLISTLIALHDARGLEIISGTASADGNPFAFAAAAVASSADTTSFSSASSPGAGDLATVSITATPGYRSAQACVQECLYFDFPGISDILGLPNHLGCFTFSLPLFSPFKPRLIP